MANSLSIRVNEHGDGGGPLVEGGADPAYLAGLLAVDLERYKKSDVVA